MRERLGTRRLIVVVLAIASLGLVGGLSYAAGSTTNASQGGGVITACVWRQTGVLRVINPEAGQDCRSFERRLTWRSGSGTYRYISQQGPEGTAVRVFCPPGHRVSGGGGFSLSNDRGLVQNHPISDRTGVIAFGTTAIGWQVAAEGFGAVTAFVICVE